MRISDWSSDVCSSDLGAAKALNGGVGLPACFEQVVDAAALVLHAKVGMIGPARAASLGEDADVLLVIQDRKRVVSGKSVSVRVALGGRLIIKKTNSTISYLDQFLSLHNTPTPT